MIAMSATAALAKGPVYLDPAKADADFALQGEYVGEITAAGKPVKVGAQVIALGGGKFDVVFYDGGLPGAGSDGKTKMKATAESKDGAAKFSGDKYQGDLKDGQISLANKAGKQLGTLAKVHRESPTLGAKPPEGAIVLFDGTTADNFNGGKLTEDGLLMAGCTSKRKFGDLKLHIEFILPYQPEDRGQGRGNSGIYLQGRYETQMLDSFGLEGKENECGGIYTVSPPDVNMCLPPLAWQTYDIDYTAAKYENGKLVANPRVTVQHNGVTIHKDRELPGERNTTAAPVKAGPDDGPIYLQNHGNPVRYRNIWVVEKK
jgi:hypothetical protein